MYLKAINRILGVISWSSIKKLICISKYCWSEEHISEPLNLSYYKSEMNKNNKSNQILSGLLIWLENLCIIYVTLEDPHQKYDKVVERNCFYY